ncbi:helicase-related protein [Demequina sp.]|uniref:helicase-related protein n=1 Tax=Demequina sp. TaxID=2050685 RepID=UPI0025C3B3E9|nr:helicase-related protein [Demequina sp.]
MTSKSPGQAAVADYLAAHFVGPKFGGSEVLEASPTYAYLSGMLFPVEDEDGSPVDEPVATMTVGGDDDVILDVDSELSDYATDEDLGSLTAATGWVPSALGLSCVHDAPSLRFTARAAVYEPVGGEEVRESRRSTADGSWRRRELPPTTIEVPGGASDARDIWDGRARLQWRSRNSQGNSIITVALSNLSRAKQGTAKREVEKVLFQCEVEVEVIGGELLPYPSSAVVNASTEDRELAYRYRNHPSFAVGHGVGTAWSTSRPVVSAVTTAMPHQVVPPVVFRSQSDRALQMRWLADESVPETDLLGALRGLFADYVVWARERETEALAEPDSRDRATATAIVARIRRATERIEAGIQLLGSDKQVRKAFHLANLAMAMQASRGGAKEPAWRPFQLAFILMALPSTVDPSHEERDLVDLIWFPTGGGKTEAYLGLAAVEMVRRRLSRGYQGGGTAVITRYTMRLLTAQQFQRTARLICALELLRLERDELKASPPFGIGLLLGNETTPGTFKSAVESLKDVRSQQTPENPFQVRMCPWCSTPLLPTRRSGRDDAYGFDATPHSFRIYCVNKDCEFHGALPLQVVDEGIFASPPTVVVATVDKFARLAWTANGGSVFGLANVPFDPPSIVIQDELHLISGPLGTIVGIYEAALRALLAWRGTTPKTVASTATIRSASEQVRGLMAAEVSVFPPSGLNADDSYFARIDRDSPGRLYLGLMPQAFAPAWSIGQVAGRLLAGADAVPLEPQERDSYWTLVLYHNSLRELGRTVTILRDDVRDLLQREAKSRVGARTLTPDGVVELTSNVKSHELVEVLERLAVAKGEPGAIDAVAATNILSVGIDVSRLGLMLVNGQPKTTSEYIQATSRVGRDETPGIVMTLYRSGKARDRSTFESFSNFHNSFYRFVEPTSVTPWALQARRRAARAALVILVRHGAGWSSNSSAGLFEQGARGVQKALSMLERHITVADPREAADVLSELRAAADDWAARIRSSPTPLKYESRKDVQERLLKSFGDDGPGWPTMHSMRSVDRQVRIRPRGEST